MLYAILLCILIVIVIFVFFRHVHTIYNENSDIPGPRPLPILGNIFDIGANGVELRKTVLKLHEVYGPIFKIRVGPSKVIINTKSVKDLETVMNSTVHISKSNDYNYLTPWLGNGLLLATGTKWKKRRRILMPAFHFSILEKFTEIYDSASGIMVEKLNEKVGQEEFDIFPYITLCALDIISETSMGTSIKAQENSDSDYVKAVRNICGIFNKRVFSLVKMFDFPFQFTADGRLHQECLKTLHTTTIKVIESRREQLQNSTFSRDESESVYGIKNRCAFLDLLLQSTMDGKPLSNEDIREEVDTFMFAGHDTVSSTIGFLILEIANHQDVQTKIFEEIRSILGDDLSRVATQSELQDMRYLDLVIKETLRLYPPVPMIARKIESPLKLETATISNCSLQLNIYAAHRDPKLYSDPEKFIPERFLEERYAENAFNFVPFSAGPRNCIGQKFGILEMKAMVSKLLRHFEIHPGKSQRNVTINFSIVAKSVDGIKVKLTARNY